MDRPEKSLQPNLEALESQPTGSTSEEVEAQDNDIEREEKKIALELKRLEIEERKFTLESSKEKIPLELEEQRLRIKQMEASYETNNFLRRTSHAASLVAFLALVGVGAYLSVHSNWVGFQLMGFGAMGIFGGLRAANLGAGTIKLFTSSLKED